MLYKLLLNYLSGVCIFMKVRSDAWLHEEDLLLAETVLRHIREGSTQLRAFEEVGDKLNRTSAACGFRWNAEIRKNYEQAVSLAKKQRKELKRVQANEHKLIVENETQLESKTIIPTIPQLETSYQTEMATELVPVLSKNITLDDVITFLQNNYSTTHTTIQKENEQLIRENQLLQQKYEQLKESYEKLEQQQQVIQEDYEAILHIMNRARTMANNENIPHPMAPIFKMDQNGNLEIV